YLIERYGKDKLDHLINKRIIEHAARQRGIDVTEGETEAAFYGDAAALGLSSAEFKRAILQRYGKSLFEWKEDVIKPRLLMEKMCRARVTVTNEDLVQAFEAYYGEKVDCKMIIWPKNPQSEKNLMKIWPKLRDDEKEFDSYARLQPSASLAAVGGHVKPLGRH